jgi:DNA-binding transcriptional LysR family regulator
MNLLHAIETFVRVAEAGSFSAVARTSNTSQSSVTRTIEQLENHFGIRLLHRTTRRLSVTVEGKSLLSHAREIVAAAEEMEAALGRRQASPAGLVRVGLPPDMASLVTSRLATLLGRYPGLAVDLVIGDRFGDMVEERLDLVVRTGRLEAASTVARVITTFSRAVVAAPAYLDQHGLPGCPKELAQHRCIVHENGPDSDCWNFSGPAGPVDVRVTGPLRANSAAMIRQAALAGYGIAYISEPLVTNDIRANRLRRLVPNYTSEQERTFVAYPSRRHVPPRTRVVIDLFVEAGREAQARFARGGSPDGDERLPWVNGLIAA